MQTTDTKDTTSNERQTAKEQSTVNGKGTTTGTPKDIWEQFAGVIQEDKEGVKNWYKVLSNPLIVIIGLFLLGYWLFTQKRESGTNSREPQKEPLEKEVKRLKKKQKRLKKNIHAQTGYGKSNKRLAVLD